MKVKAIKDISFLYQKTTIDLQKYAVSMEKQGEWGDDYLFNCLTGKVK